MNKIEFRIGLLRKGLSQNRLAQKIGLHPQHLSAIVCGYRKVKSQIRARISKELGIAENRLFPEAQYKKDATHG